MKSPVETFSQVPKGWTASSWLRRLDQMVNVSANAGRKAIFAAAAKRLRERLKDDQDVS